MEGLKELDFDRKTNTKVSTEIFTKVLQKLNRLYVGMSANGLCKLLFCITPKTLYEWEEAGIIFPQYKKGKVNTYRHYALKDVLRGITIKYLSIGFKIKSLTGIKLFLEMVNERLKLEKNNRPTIDNIYIDRYLIRVLNYDIEKISLMSKKSRKSKENVNDENS